MTSPSLRVALYEFVITTAITRVAFLEKEVRDTWGSGERQSEWYFVLTLLPCKKTEYVEKQWGQRSLAFRSTCGLFIHVFPSRSAPLHDSP